MKKLKDTKIGAFLKDKAPEVLDVVGDLLPDSGALGIVKNVIDKVAPDRASELKSGISELELEYYRTEIEDRKSARERQVEVLKAGGKDYMMTVAGVVALVVFMIAILVGLFTELTESQEKVYLHILGIVEGVALTIWNFYYGSSAGSKEKDKK